MKETEIEDPAFLENRLKKKKKIRRIILLAIGLILIFALSTFRIWGPNTSTGENGFYLYIPTNANFKTVLDSLKKNNVLRSEWAFTWLSHKKSYDKRIEPGRYLVTNAMSNNLLINRLRSGDQDPVDLMFNSLRTREQLAGRIAEQIEPDSIAILNALNSVEKTAAVGFTPANIMALFIPNTYEVYWDYSPEKFLSRMFDEYNNFWSRDKVQSAKEAGLKPEEVIILASIVEEETNKDDEKPRIAGVYINRLRRGMPLEADPTLKFALGDFAIKRVLNADKEVESPYNTYKYRGLPPGPICLPSATTIKAVLHFEEHQFIFFCANEDLSGYHRFARSLEQHNENARLYQKALNGLNIKR